MANAPATSAPQPADAPARPRHTMPSATPMEAMPAMSDPMASPDVTVGTFTYASANGVPPTGCQRLITGGRGADGW